MAAVIDDRCDAQKAKAHNVFEVRAMSLRCESKGFVVVVAQEFFGVVEGVDSGLAVVEVGRR